MQAASLDATRAAVSSEDGQLMIATPYAENAIMAIARAAAARRRLRILCGSSAPALVLAVTASLKEHPTTVNKFIAKGCPEAVFEPVREDAELLRLATKALRLRPATTTRVMYWQHRVFDAGVAPLIRPLGEAAALIGLPGASLQSFQEAKRTGSLCILHFVNSHPRVQNELLRTRCGLPPSHHEMVPKRMAARVDAELSVADLVLVASEFVMNQLVSLGIPPSKLELAPYGVDGRMFHPSPHWDKSGRPIRVLYVGQVSHRKGVQLLNRAIGLMGSEATGYLVGPMVSPEVMRRAPANVTWFGPRAASSVAAAMRYCDVFVLPSVEDASGLVLTEALASGLPVVTTSTTGASRFVEPGENGFVLKDPTPAELADAIRRAHLLTGPISMPKSCPSWDSYGDSVLESIDRLRQRADGIFGDSSA